MTLWTIDVASDDWQGIKFQDCFLDVLSQNERDRYYRFKFDKDKLLYLVSHGLLRYLLSLFYKRQNEFINPKDWCFWANENGKPYTLEKDLYFNISHTGSRVFILLCRSLECGVDAEQIRSIDHRFDLAKRYFTKQECLDVINDIAPDRKFLATWILKEAYVKALGLSLGKNLKKIDFSCFNYANNTSPIRFMNVFIQKFEISDYIGAACWCGDVVGSLEVVDVDVLTLKNILNAY